jgi:hypothetical protein
MNEMTDKIHEYLEKEQISYTDYELHYNKDCGFFITSETLLNEVIIKINKEIARIETT